MRRTLPAVVAAAVVVAGLVSGCSTVVSGRGGAPTGSAATRSPATSSSGPGNTGSTGTAANRFGRTPVRTAIGDPVTADFCAAIGLGPLQKFGLSIRLVNSQFVPGCSFATTLPGGTGVSLQADVTTRPAPTRAGRSTITIAGLTVYRYQYRASDANCEFDVLARGLVVHVRSDAKPGFSSSYVKPICLITQTMATRAAAAIAAGTLPGLRLAAPSLTSLDACKIVKAARIQQLPMLTGSALNPDNFGLSCGMVTAVALYVDTVIVDGAQPKYTRAVTAGGHRLWEEIHNSRTYCQYYSTQGRAGDGRYETLTATAISTGTNPMPADACEQTEQALVRYLDTAGLH